MILPPATLGMLGGGQLGRMFTIAARNMGYRVVVLEPDPYSPAGQLADEHIQADYDDEAALSDFASRCAVITTEFENVPAQSLAFLSETTAVYPSAKAVETTQDRVVEKDFIRSCGLLTAPYHAINKLDDISGLSQDFIFPAILKTARFGYDGKGQIVVNTKDDLAAAFNELNQVPAIVEQRIDLACEVSVIIGRNTLGESGTFPIAENIHRNGILHQSIVPARIDSAIADAAKVAAQRLVDKLDYTGIMGVEFFVTTSGELLVNEIAPRTHNSGHYTIDGCVFSQFEQQVRMLCGLPFASTELLTPTVMVNLLGDVWQGDAAKWDAVLTDPQAKLHLYGKREARAGRKMGHYCCVNPSLEKAIDNAEHIYQQLLS